MTDVVLRKALALAEDLSSGIGTVDQERGGIIVRGHQLDVPVVVSGIEELQAINTKRFKFARIYTSINSFTTYVYDPDDTDGVPSSGQGSWVATIDSNTVFPIYANVNELKNNRPLIGSAVSRKVLAEANATVTTVSYLGNAKDNVPRGGAAYVIYFADDYLNRYGERPDGYVDFYLDTENKYIAKFLSPGILDVTQTGVDFTGGGDAYNAIQAGIDYVSKNSDTSMLYISPGHYRLSNQGIQMPEKKGITIFGAGYDSHLDASGARISFDVIEAPNEVIEQMIVKDLRITENPLGFSYAMNWTLCDTNSYYVGIAFDNNGIKGSLAGGAPGSGTSAEVIAEAFDVNGSPALFEVRPDFGESDGTLGARLELHAQGVNSDGKIVSGYAIYTLVAHKSYTSLKEVDKHEMGSFGNFELGMGGLGKQHLASEIFLIDYRTESGVSNVNLKCRLTPFTTTDDNITVRLKAKRGADGQLQDVY